MTWTTLPLWAVAPRIKESGRPDLPPLSVFRTDGVVPRSSREDNVNQLGEDLGTYLVVRPGDVVFNKLRTWQGGLGVSNHSGIVSPAYYVCRPKPVAYPRFLHYLLRSEPYLAELTRISKWMPPSQFDIPWDQLRNVQIVLPDVDEQRRIADFLDAETAYIDQLLELRGRQRAVLENRLNYLIDGAVIADPAALADLGVTTDDADWSAAKVAHLCHIIPGYAFPSNRYVEVEAGTRLLRGVNVGLGRVDWADTVAWDTGRDPIPQQFSLRPNDLVVGMDRPWIKGGMRLALIQDDDLPALLLQRVACLRPKPGGDIEYVQWVLRSSHFRYAAESELTGVSVPHLSADQIGGFRSRLPPSDVQRQISRALEAQTRALAELNVALQRQVEKIDRRRQALITAAVTGQMQVTLDRRMDHIRDGRG